MWAFSFRLGDRSRPNIFVRLWHHLVAAPADQLSEIARLGCDELEYLTQHREPSNFDLCAVTGGHPDDLLRRRMLALDLDPYEMTLSDPALLNHLYRCCSRCESREDCASDLACASTHAGWQRQDDWRDYCENASALEMLIALRSRSKPESKYPFPYVP